MGMMSVSKIFLKLLKIRLMINLKLYYHAKWKKVKKVLKCLNENQQSVQT